MDGEYYTVTLDTASSSNTPGTTMTVYCYAANPTHVVDEWNSRESFDTYKTIVIFFAVGTALLIAGLRGVGLFGNARKNHDIDYSKHHPAPPSAIDTYSGYTQSNYNPDIYGQGGYNQNSSDVQNPADRY